jgi:hypothetical protein
MHVIRPAAATGTIGCAVLSPECSADNCLQADALSCTVSNIYDADMAAADLP